MAEPVDLNALIGIGKKHKLGLRAFPVELRTKIFTQHFEDAEANSADRSGLLAWMYNHDYLMFCEVSPIYCAMHKFLVGAGYEFGTPLNHIQLGEHRIKDVTYMFEGEVSDTVDRKCFANQFMYRQGPWKLCYVENLTLDFTLMSAKALKYVSIHRVVMYIVHHFTSLKKLTVSLADGEGPLYSEREMGFGIRLAGDEPVETLWELHWPERGLMNFEYNDLGVIEHATGLFAKLDTVRPTSDSYPYDIYDIYNPTLLYEPCFMTHVHNSGGQGFHVVDWFWLAEEGKTITWKEENIANPMRGRITGEVGVDGIIEDL